MHLELSIFNHDMLFAAENAVEFEDQLLASVAAAAGVQASELAMLEVADGGCTVRLLVGSDEAASTLLHGETALNDIPASSALSGVVCTASVLPMPTPASPDAGPSHGVPAVASDARRVLLADRIAELMCADSDKQQECLSVADNDNDFQADDVDKPSLAEEDPRTPTSHALEAFSAQACSTPKAEGANQLRSSASEIISFLHPALRKTPLSQKPSPKGKSTPTPVKTPQPASASGATPVRTAATPLSERKRRQQRPGNYASLHRRQHEGNSESRREGGGGGGGGVGGGGQTGSVSSDSQKGVPGFRVRALDLQLPTLSESYMSVTHDDGQQHASIVLLDDSILSSDHAAPSAIPDPVPDHDNQTRAVDPQRKAMAAPIIRKLYQATTEQQQQTASAPSRQRLRLVDLFNAYKTKDKLLPSGMRLMLESVDSTGMLTSELDDDLVGCVFESVTGRPVPRTAAVKDRCEISYGELSRAVKEHGTNVRRNSKSVVVPPTSPSVVAGLPSSSSSSNNDNNNQDKKPSLKSMFSKMRINSASRTAPAAPFGDIFSSAGAEKPLPPASPPHDHLLSPSAYDAAANPASARLSPSPPPRQPMPTMAENDSPPQHPSEAALSEEDSGSNPPTLSSRQKANGMMVSVASSDTSSKPLSLWYACHPSYFVRETSLIDAMQQHAHLDFTVTDWRMMPVSEKVWRLICRSVPSRGTKPHGDSRLADPNLLKFIHVEDRLKSFTQEQTVRLQSGASDVQQRSMGPKRSIVMTFLPRDSEQNSEVNDDDWWVDLSDSDLDLLKQALLQAKSDKRLMLERVRSVQRSIAGMCGCTSDSCPSNSDPQAECTCEAWSLQGVDVRNDWFAVRDLQGIRRHTALPSAADSFDWEEKVEIEGSQLEQMQAKMQMCLNQKHSLGNFLLRLERMERFITHRLVGSGSDRLSKCRVPLAMALFESWTRLSKMGLLNLRQRCSFLTFWALDRWHLIASQGKPPLKSSTATTSEKNLESLKTLYDQGLLTPDEYQSKRERVAALQ